ncbi:MAG: hypothetical protein AB1599_06220 [Planctomycetota bacterium]
MYALDDKEKKLLGAYKGKKLLFQIALFIGFIIMGVISSLGIVLFAIFDEHWQFALRSPTIEINGLTVNNPFISLTITRIFGLLFISLIGITQLVHLKKIKKLISIINKLLESDTAN